MAHEVGDLVALRDDPAFTAWKVKDKRSPSRLIIYLPNGAEMNVPESDVVGIDEVQINVLMARVISGEARVASWD